MFDVEDTDVIRAFQQYSDAEAASAFLMTADYAAYVAAVEHLLGCTVRTLGSEADGAVEISITGSGPCTAIVGTLEFDNRSAGECGSDINAVLEPGSHRLSVTGGQYGGDGGSWAPLPDDIAAASGVMTYRVGISSWPITLPPLEPGEYTIRVPGVACEDLVPLVETTFAVERA